VNAVPWKVLKAGIDAAAPVTLGGGSPPTPQEAIVALTAKVEALFNKGNTHTIQIGTLVHRLDAAQSKLAELDTPANNAALEVILASVAKPGIHTTEFWLNLLAAVGTLALAFSGDLSGTTAAWITLGVAILHTASRSSLKSKAADAANKSIR
jgi:hypothetical protein